jgi:hypothetical protein
MKRTCVFILSTCLAVGGAIFVTDTANAKPKVAKVGKGVSKAGRTLPSAINTILSGVGTPSASLGRDGDFYIDRKAWQFFGPKTKGHWPLPVLLVGPSGGPGPSGAPGPTGPQGKVGVKGEGGNSGATGTSSITAGSAGPIGPSGPGGAPGPIGAAGAPGSPGATGPVGSNGAPGSTGSAGPTGATGGSGLPGPTGAGGSTGATGVQGLKGDTGSTGLAGAPGTIGPRGPSAVTFILIPTFRLSSSAANTDATSSAFGSLLANQNYQFTLVAHGKGSTASNRPFAFLVTGTSTVIISSDTSVSESVTFDKTTNAVAHEYVFRAFGTASGGPSGGSLFFTVTDGLGTTGASSMAITGSCTLQQIESLD